jgi:hypothetical protein
MPSFLARRLHTYNHIPLDAQFRQQKCGDLPSNNPVELFSQTSEATAASDHLLQAINMYLAPCKIVKMGLLCCQSQRRTNYEAIISRIIN